MQENHQKKIEALETELKIYKESPYETAYMAAVNTVNKYCEQLKANHVDLFNEDDKPKFEMVHKFMIELDLYLKTIDNIRGKMNPDVAKAADKKIKQSILDEKDKSLAL